MAHPWRKLPPNERPVPVIALLARSDGVWAGGAGGLAWFSESDGWFPPAVNLPLQAVAALAAGGGTLFAAGVGGIARSTDGGTTWQRSSLPDGTGTVTALVVSPQIDRDGVALAATIDGGVLRSADGGRAWQTSSFGLQTSEVLALAWGEGETVVAATAAGLYQSPNAGRAWRSIAATAGRAFAAVVILADGSMLAAPDLGPLLRSTSDITRWAPVAGLPDDVQISALLPLATGVLAGTADHGLVRSSGDFEHWTKVSPASVFCLAIADTRIYAGTSSGVMASDDAGAPWMDLPPPPLHDLRRIVMVDGRPLLFGTYSAPLRLDEDGTWTELADVPLPLLGLFAAPKGTLFASTPEALFRSIDRGQSWEPVVDGNGGGITQMTFASARQGWAGVTADGGLLQTRDGGRGWQRLPSPFGVLPLVALQAFPRSPGDEEIILFAATYDERRRAVTIWRSNDGGERWARGADSPTAWPVVATAALPPLVATGNAVTIRQPSGEWRRITVGETGVRQVASSDNSVFALTEDGLWRSDDRGETWRRDDEDLPVAEVLDIGVSSNELYALLNGGRLWMRPLFPSTI
jgi:photosystem II stability/assembly factor-like uncharacterized protein